jgi:hypothetical protein
VGFITKYYGKEGGLGRFEDRIKPMMEASKRLKKQYGEYGDIKVRGNGMAEFVLKKIPSRVGEQKEMSNKNKTKSKSKTNSNKKTKKNR